MSQARQIYEYLGQTRNKAADDALRVALQRAEEPYRTAILDTLLERGRGEATWPLIERYHEYPPSWQELLVERVDGLFEGLRLAERSPGVQGRLNALELVRRTEFHRRADVPAVLLRDQDRHVAQAAGDTLLSLSRSFVSRYGVVTTEMVNRKTARDLQQAQERAFVSALAGGIRNFRVHRRSEAVLAAMTAVPADVGVFWKNQLEPHHLVGRSVRLYLTNYDRPELARFCLSALKTDGLRATAARAICTHQRRDFVLSLAREFGAHADADLRRGLGLVKQPRWLDVTSLPPAELAQPDQIAIVKWVAALGIAPERSAAYLGAVAAAGAYRAGLKAVAALVRQCGLAATEGLKQALNSVHEPVALAAARQLIKRQVADLPQIMARQLRSTNPRVRSAAQGYYQEIAFNAYWRNFDYLSRQAQMAGGRAVFKIDAHAESHWRWRARAQAPWQRQRAVSIARLLHKVEPLAQDLITLARDSDERVRSSAIAALGETRMPDAHLDHSLMAALEDTDARVRANAVEAIEQRDVREMTGSIAKLATDTNNRVRANAVKALLRWKVTSAQAAIREMLHDSRPQHRRSAEWVTRQVPDWEQDFTAIHAADQKEAKHVVGV